jgi:hypothetical protein
MPSAVLDRVLAIPDYDDRPQMGLSRSGLAALVERGGVTLDGKKAKSSVLKRVGVKGDRQLSDKELKQAQYEKKEAYRDRVSKLMYAPVGVAPTTGKALKMIESMDEGELAKYEGKAKGKESLRYTVGTEKAKKRINDLQSEINSLSERVGNQEQKLIKAQNSKADRAGKNAAKKRGENNPYGLEADGIGSAWTKSAQKVRSLNAIYDSSVQELEELKSKRNKLRSVWGDRIAIKDRKDAQEKKLAPAKPVNKFEAKLKDEVATTAKYLKTRTDKPYLVKQGVENTKRNLIQGVLDKTKASNKKLLNPVKGERKLGVRRQKRAMTDRDIARNAGIASAKLESQGQLNIFNQPERSVSAKIAPETAKKVKPKEYVRGQLKVGSQRANRAVNKVYDAIPSAKFAVKTSPKESDKNARFTFENTPENVAKFRAMGGTLTRDQKEAKKRVKDDAANIAKNVKRAIANTKNKKVVKQKR